MSREEKQIFLDLAARYWDAVENHFDIMNNSLPFSHEWTQSSQVIDGLMKLTFKELRGVAQFILKKRWLTEEEEGGDVSGVEDAKEEDVNDFTLSPEEESDFNGFLDSLNIERHDD